jgi:hypothetical protein
MKDIRAISNEVLNHVSNTLGLKNTAAFVLVGVAILSALTGVLVSPVMGVLLFLSMGLMLLIIVMAMHVVFTNQAIIRARIQTLDDKLSRELQATIDQLRQESTRQKEVIERQKESIANQKERIERQKESIASQKERIERLREQTDGKLKKERSERIASFARRDGKGIIPQNIAILLTVHRCGSTWLFDMLRVHPAIQLHPSAIIYEALAVNGGRYPRDLADGGDARIDFEIQPYTGVKIPDFAHRAIDADPDVTPYAIEKIHPIFFGDDVDQLLKRTAELEGRGHTVKFIYQVRDPRATLLSFRNYQRRNPAWYQNYDLAGMIAMMDGGYRAITEAAQKRPGLIMDYSELKESPTGALQRIYDFLWDGAGDPAIAQAIAEQAVQRTRREDRQTANPAFLGNQEGPVITDNLSDEFADHAATIEAIYTPYRDLLALNTK